MLNESEKETGFIILIILIIPNPPILDIPPILEVLVEVLVLDVLVVLLILEEEPLAFA